ncbi:MAG TPA: RNase P subunit p30 family protein [archaeon]|nr:RNase P subunit p30 family protein [archaeon]
MPFFDLHVHSAFSEGESSVEQLAATAKLLGYSGICFAEYYKGEEQIKKLATEIQKAKDKVGIEIFLGFEARNSKELNILADKRKKFDVLLVHGGDVSLNREAAETPQVDILTHPEAGRYDSGMNHIMMKLAAKNNVAIEVNFREVLMTSKKSRSTLLQNISSNIAMARKFHAPIAVCSGAISHWELRDPQAMASFASQLGLTLNEATDCVSKVPEKIVRESESRRSTEWIAPGVKIVRK